MESQLTLKSTSIPLNSGENDQLLLCTDGLSKMVEGDQIAAVLAGHESLEDKCADLIKLANAAGGNDNVTVLISQNDQEK